MKKTGLDAPRDPSDERSTELIVLVDEAGNAIGEAEKWSSHHSQTPLHLAFSCYVFDDQGRFLMTRRALTKKVWPGVWSNSVCGHPEPGESIPEAIQRRLEYELGMTARDLQVVLPNHLYKAPAFQGIVEYEFCPVFVARAVGEPKPNPDEVEEWRWLPWEGFVDTAEKDTEDLYSWWCKNQIKELKGSLMVSYSAPVDRELTPLTVI